MQTESLFVPWAPAGDAASVPIVFNGQPLQVPVASNVAAALLAAGVRRFRRSPVSGDSRAPYCLMGVCFECLLEIDGVPNRQACPVSVRAGMSINTQDSLPDAIVDTAGGVMASDAGSPSQGMADVVIIGDGPADISAAIAAHWHGASVIVLNEQPVAGGQIYQGVVPHTQITWSLRTAHAWDDLQLCWSPITDEWGEFDVPGIFVAGDGRGIGGAHVAASQSEVCGSAAAARVGRMSVRTRDAAASPLRAETRRQLFIRPFLDAVYRPEKAHRIPADGTLVCLCEEVTAEDIRQQVAMGCTGPNQAKSFGRCGMGSCQGQQCGLMVTGVIADVRQVPVNEAGYFRTLSAFERHQCRARMGGRRGLRARSNSRDRPSRHVPQLVHAFGFSAHGFALGPICGRSVSELVLDGRSRLPIEAFAVDRFAANASA